MRIPLNKALAQTKLFKKDFLESLENSIEYRFWDIDDILNLRFEYNASTGIIKIDLLEKTLETGIRLRAKYIHHTKNLVTHKLGIDEIYQEEIISPRLKKFLDKIDEFCENIKDKEQIKDFFVDMQNNYLPKNKINLSFDDIMKLHSREILKKAIKK